MIVNIRNRKLNLNNVPIKYFRERLFTSNEDNYFCGDYINVGDRDIELIKINRWGKDKWVLLYPCEISLFKRKKLIDFILKRYFSEYFSTKERTEQIIKRTFKQFYINEKI